MYINTNALLRLSSRSVAPPLLLDSSGWNSNKLGPCEADLKVQPVSNIALTSQVGGRWEINVINSVWILKIPAFTAQSTCKIQGAQQGILLSSITKEIQSDIC